jgi:hypothetical protein
LEAGHSRRSDPDLHLQEEEEEEEEEEAHSPQVVQQKEFQALLYKKGWDSCPQLLTPCFPWSDPFLTTTIASSDDEQLLLSTSLRMAVVLYDPSSNSSIIISPSPAEDLY